MEKLNEILVEVVDVVWGPPLLISLIGVGLLLTIYSRMLPFRFLRHGVDILRGKYDDHDDPGDIDHYQALSTALASTIGMGNIAGVAVAITQGGPGAVFWMWLAAIVGMATKFFSCTLAVMYRGTDSAGEVQGGPMYYIEVGLGKKWRWLAVLFSVFGTLGCLAMFQSNQLAEALTASHSVPPDLTAAIVVGVVGIVVVGGIERIGQVASRLVPAMCVLYLAMAVTIIVMRFETIPGVIAEIFRDAFTGTAAVGGAQGIAVITVIQTGIKRAAFSNEAGIGTAPMAHGAAKTTEPVREGLVAMIGPFIDTIIVCTLTALVVLSDDQWRSLVGVDVKGVAVTLDAVGSAMGGFGQACLLLILVMFSITTMFGYSYYGKKCFAYLFGAERSGWYVGIYIWALGVGAVWDAGTVVNLLDIGFALMTAPNLLALMLLAPKVMEATRDYFDRFERGETKGQKG